MPTPAPTGDRTAVAARPHPRLGPFALAGAACGLAILLLPALLAGPAGGAPAAMSFGPPGAWVESTALPPPLTASALAPAGDVELRLCDIQRNVTLDPPEAFFRFASQALNEQGLAEVSQVSATFNPAYERLIWHEVLIHRGATTIRVPLAGRFRLLHREERLEDQVYDGRLTAIMPLEDVRPGDVVDASYTLRGANPAKAGHLGITWSTSGVFEIGRLHLHLLWPAGRPLAVHRGPGAPELRAWTRGDVREYELSADGIQPVKIEPGVPGWYDPFPMIDLEDVTTWNEVARWAVSLFPASVRVSPALSARVAELQRSSRNREEQAMAAIRFVQDDVRYLGIEIGQNAQRAFDPNLVLRRRFGDCKDKAYLLVVLLRALGFQADPALVHSEMRDSVGARGPTTRFDHVIVRLRDPASGVTTWVDATDTGQRGSRLANLVDPGFGAALVVSDSTRGLSRITGPFGAAMTVIDKALDSPGRDAPATLKVHTVFYGPDANAARAMLHGVGSKAVQESYLDFYRTFFPAIEVLQPIAVFDDEAQNSLQLWETYRLPGFWERDSTHADANQELGAIELANDLPAWRGTKRAMPLGMGRPRHVRYRAAIDLPGGRRAAGGPVSIDAPGMKLRTRQWNQGKQLVQNVDLDVDGGALTAAQAAAASPRFEAMLRALSLERAPSAGPAPAAGAADAMRLAALLMGLALGAVLCVIAYRAPTPAFPWLRGSFARHSEPWLPDQAIGGWLFLLAVSVVVTPFVVAFTAGTLLAEPALPQLFAGQEGSALHALFLGIVAAVAAQFAASILLLVVFLQRRRKFFPCYLGFHAFTLLTTLASVIFILALGQHTGGERRALTGILRQLAGVALWSAYFLRSRRVEATFVR